jgi:DNA ligase (NAD+)
MRAMTRWWSSCARSKSGIPQLVTADSPTRRVGGVPGGAFGEVVHACPMLSLDNAFTEQDVLDFDRRVRERLDVDAVDYSASPRSTASRSACVYEHGRWCRRPRAATAPGART